VVVDAEVNETNKTTQGSKWRSVFKKDLPGPTLLEMDTPASFSFAAFNGRGLCDDVMDVILTLVTNTALGDGVAPDMRLMRPDFPYFGEPHPTAASAAKQ
jgi:hypothetical protein